LNLISGFDVTFFQFCSFTCASFKPFANCSEVQIDLTFLKQLLQLLTFN
jgi:hypothetical protein